VDPHRTGSVNRVGAETLENRPTALRGDRWWTCELSAGWLYEGNAVLHPRGLNTTRNSWWTAFRLPTIAREFRYGDRGGRCAVAEHLHGKYSRGIWPKLGGVIEVVTAKDPRLGFHGKASLRAEASQRECLCTGRVCAAKGRRELLGERSADR